MNIKNNKDAIRYLKLAVYFLIATGIVFLFTKNVAQRTVVSGDSMYPTLKDGDNLIVEKISYKLSNIKRYDIVVFPYDENGIETYYIKRVIALPGETVLIKDGTIYIDGEKLNDEYGYYTDGYILKGYLAEEEIELMDDEYFVLGDNRNNSKDSRIIGPVKKEAILGRAFFRFYPFTSVTSIINK
jgi:signal peptidase I